MTSGGVTGDPFFDELRRLQPDVDVVVLPPDRTPSDTPVLDLATQQRHQAAVAEVLHHLLVGAGLAGLTRAGQWRRTTGAAHRWVVVPNLSPGVWSAPETRPWIRARLVLECRS